MSNTQCFKIKKGTDYFNSVKQHFELLPQWKEVYGKVSELLGEEIKALAYETRELYVDVSDLKKEENIKLFTKNGNLKNNTKKAKMIRSGYEKIIQEAGLTSYRSLSSINFAYGIFRTQGQTLESFRTSEGDLYYKANFDLEQKTKGLVEPITEIEYEEKYLEELKKNQ